VVSARVVALLVAVAFLAAVLGWRIAQPDVADADSADVGFLLDMTTHHEQAIYLSSVELQHGATREMQVFAEEIHRFQSYEIGLMERFLVELGHDRYDPPKLAMTWMGHPVPRDSMPGLASEDEIAALQDATGDDVDAMFTALMVDHHAAGAEMAAHAAETVDDDDVRELAERMAKIQQQEISEMLRAAEQLGLDVPPSGVTWDVYAG
jgi:uncharacterized protein (DUF305 family)